MPDREKVVEIFSELINFADYDVHPVVSPENWDVYSKLRDLIDQAEEDVLTLLKDQEAVEPIPYHRSDGTIFKYECRKCRTKYSRWIRFADVADRR